MKKILLIFLFLLNYSLGYAQTQEVSKDSIVKLITDSFMISNQGKYELALKQLDIALEYGKKHKNDSIVGDAYNCIGVTYLNMENFEKAKEYLKLSSIALEKANYKSYLVYNHNNIAAIYEFEKDTFAAKKHYVLAKNLALDLNDGYLAFLPTYHLGRLQYYQKAYKLAKVNLEASLPNYKANSEHQSITFVAINTYLAKIYFKEGNITKSLKYLKVADSLAIETNDLNNLKIIEKTRYRILKSENKLAEADASLQKVVDYLEKRLKKREEELKERSKLERTLVEKESSLKLTREINKNQKATLAKTRLFTFIILMMFVITCITSFLLYRSNHKRHTLNKTLEDNNKKLQDSKEKTEYASKLKENFFSTINHELRTPLYAVTGITDILIDDSPKIEHIHYLKTLKSSGEHLLGLINNILQINKFDANKIEINTIDFNIRSLINNIKDSLSYLKSENNNVIHIDMDEATPDILQGDSLKIAQIIVNLLSNALKFTKEGNVWILVECIEKTEKNVTLDIKVKDDGIGISKDMQAQIFEDFYQESMQLDRNYEGTGLGLAIVKRLLNAMGSEIKVKSNTKEGATFYFSLKLNIKKQIPAPKLKTKENIDLKGNHFLVVDDNAINLMITRRILESKKASVTVAKNGYEAIEKIKSNTFDVVLMDIHMPKMNGYDTTEKIREFDKVTPIIALTAVTLDDNKNKIMDSGMNGVITKPFVMEDFFYEIKGFL